MTVGLIIDLIKDGLHLDLFSCMLLISCAF